MKGMAYPGTKKKMGKGKKSMSKGPKTYGAMKDSKSVKKSGAI